MKRKTWAWEGFLCGLRRVEGCSGGVAAGVCGESECGAALFLRDFLTEECPNDTAVGEETLGIGEVPGYESEKLHRVVEEIQYVTDPVYNVVPPGGVAQELGFMVLRHPVLLDAAVRTGGDYGITTISPNISEALVIMSTKVTVWGVPGDPSHDRLRGKCLREGESFRKREE